MWLFTVFLCWHLFSGTLHTCSYRAQEAEYWHQAKGNSTTDWLVVEWLRNAPLGSWKHVGDAFRPLWIPIWPKWFWLSWHDLLCTMYMKLEGNISIVSGHRTELLSEDGTGNLTVLPMCTLLTHNGTAGSQKVNWDCAQVYYCELWCYLRISAEHCHTLGKISRCVWTSCS